MKNILITVQGLPTDAYTTILKLEKCLREFGASVAMTNNREDIADMVRLNDYTIFEDGKL